jgi:hypothetical protein
MLKISTREDLERLVKDGVKDEREGLRGAPGVYATDRRQSRPSHDRHSFAGQARMASRPISDSFSRAAPSRACTASPRATAL